MPLEVMLVEVVLAEIVLLEVMSAQHKDHGRVRSSAMDT
jgi:hypothetical protein